ncbi:MAG: tetratricopeptide repeat protein [Okeania sp. SIO2G4]|uniref:tetratricopeptide repeat protein n=1 Tax=unclassified Okeania TaxID=2634635 RepID=UPI0013B60E20|nr:MULTISPECIES: tetratricopeptide repeat protein [unclassified Okeania]NEP70737.1 tetratricopeptide repeat protein [Okeania sp. SIO2G5]NEP93436.1 tetratricopeptide repeat protein [Okeania sp. SIO2F5]NEQ92709.1 tetratricopeptide repeat protein [Okeania sp. SIO2G4]
MNQQNISSYVGLIQSLLVCPSGDENKILQANQNLIDHKLVQVMKQIAKMNNIIGNLNAQWLQNLAIMLETNLEYASQPVNREIYRNFLMQVLQVISENEGKPEAVYSVLEYNQDKLNQNFLTVLRTWPGENIQKMEPQLAQNIALDVVNLSNLILQFPFGNQSNNVEIAIVGYENALQVLSRQQFPITWATIQNNLGTSYHKRIVGNPEENIELAIACYDQALQVRTYSALPEAWASTQNNLGNAYQQRSMGKRIENLENAINCYQKALRVRTLEKLPQEWASIQNNLGSAYHDRIAGEQQENIEQAIACYNLALKVRTRQQFPTDWATTQNNLGNAYIDRITGDRQDNLEQAIACFVRAQEVYTKESYPLYWEMIFNNLGIVYNEQNLRKVC